MLGYFGAEIYRQAPPVPKRVVTTDGTVLFTGQDIKDGQNVWQSMGGQEVGTIWGHGAYVAPDWTADWLHREATWLLNHWAAQSGGKTYEQLPAETQAALRERLKQEIRSNTYHAGDRRPGGFAAARGGDPGGGRALRGAVRRRPGLAEAAQELTRFPANAIKTPERRQLMNAFFFWAAWACGTERPGHARSPTRRTGRPRR